MPKTQHREVIAADEAAKLIGVSKVTALRLYNAGKLEGYPLTDIAGSPVRIYRDSVIRYVKEVQHRDVN